MPVIAAPIDFRHVGSVIGAAFRRQSKKKKANSSFTEWSQELLSWSTLATDMDAAMWCNRIVLQLQGPARELACNTSYQDLMQEGSVVGPQVAPVFFLLRHPAFLSGSLGTESKLTALIELISLAKRIT